MSTQISSGESRTTIIASLQHHATVQPDNPVFTFLMDGDLDEQSITFAVLDKRARYLGAILQSYGCSQGDRVLLMYPHGIEFIAAYMACLYAGVIAVPVPPPRLKKTLPRLVSVVQDAGAKVVFTDQSILTNFEDRIKEIPELAGIPWLATDADFDVSEADFKDVIITPDDIAFLQYTSGSTGVPKGVMVSHQNLQHNQDIIRDNLAITGDSVGMSWLPVYHDMGLIGHVLQAFHVGGHSILMSPIAFLQRPARWLEAISRHKVTTSGAPNFAYELCTRKVSEEERSNLDLSSWQVAYSGAEPVHIETLNRFAEEFAPYGFNPRALVPSYGLAESTLVVTTSKMDSPVKSLSVSRSALGQSRVVPITDDSDNSSSLRLTSVGQAAGELDVRIVDYDTLTAVPENRVGEIWIKGQSVAQGYYGNEEATEATFKAHLSDTGEGPYLRTGDLGFMNEGELYITGRLKAMLIIRGQNYYSEDIEYTVANSHPAIEAGAIAAFSVDVDENEQLVIACELERSQRNTDPQEVITSIRRSVFEAHGIPAYSVALLRPATMPLTTSGKVQRFECKNQFLNNSLRLIKADALDRQGQDANVEYVAPRNSTEEIVVNIWQDVLNVPQIGVHHDFFLLGGQSLNATQVIVRLRDSFGLELSLRSLFESPTPAMIASLIDDQQGERIDVPPIQIVSRDGILPLSYSQERMWFLYQLNPTSLAYNVGVSLRLDGTIDIPTFERAIKTIIERHEGLRSTFELVGGEVSQVVHETISDVFDLSSVESYPADKREQAAKRKLEEMNQQPFDLEEGPLLRVNMVRIQEDAHLLGLVMHHIISDAWSISVLAQELATLYEQYAFDEEKNLPEIDIQMADFASWQRQWVRENILDEQLAYWKQQLAGAPDILELPIDRPRPPVQTYSGGYVNLDLPDKLLDQLRLLSQREGVTLYMLLLAAFNTLLHHYTARDDILVATPVANRQVLPAENLIGTFVNTLVMRTDLSGNPTLRELLQRIRPMAIEAYANQDFPFEQLVQELRPARDPSRSPLVQVMLTLANVPIVPYKMRGVEWDVLTDFDAVAAQFDLTLTMVDVPDVQSMSFVYNSDLFDESTIERMAGHFLLLLKNIVQNPGAQLSQISILPEHERHHLLVEWNNMSCDFPEEMCLHQLIELQVERTPDRVAARFETETISYRDLNTRANQLAHHLQSLGVVPDSLVGVHLERSLEMLIAVLAVQKSGGAYVPLDPGFPKERLNLIVEDSKIRVLITQSGLDDSRPEHNAEMIFIDDDWGEIAKQPVTNPTSDVSPHNLVYVIFTSGSTGRPKGVQLEHRSVVNFLNSMGKQPGLDADDVLLAVTTLSFDIAVLELYLPLLTGAQVLIASREETLNGQRLIDMIEDYEVTIMQATPATWQLMLEAGWTKNSRKIKSLCGGEALPLDLANRLIKRTSSLWNMYGPTETTVWSTVYQVRDTRNGVLIGRPIDNTTIYILDKYGHPAPIGIPGELIIGGDGLARGYFERQDLTDEKFVPDPFIGRDGARMYKTGDIVRYLPDGNIQFYGRIDNQVKVRGFRIELGEIETVLGEHADIKQNVVIVREDQPGNKMLVAYMVTNSGDDIPTNQLRDFVSETLPQYMIPAIFVRMDDLPLTPNGKINRRALPAPDLSLMDTGTEYVAPRNRTEEALVKIWEELLGVPRVGIEDNFFDLGGHSLLAARFVGRVEKDLDVTIPLAKLFANPTIGVLSKVVLDQTMEARVITEQIPFFWAHGTDFGNLKTHIGADQPFFNLFPSGLDGQSPIYDDLDSIVNHYIEQMHRTQPMGPYMIGGYCGGGELAFAIARELKSRGEEVVLLAMIDVGRLYEGRQRTLLEKIMYHLRNGQFLRTLGIKLRDLFEMVAASLFVNEHGLRIYHIIEKQDKAFRHYEPESYPGKIVLFECEEYYNRDPDAFKFWENLAEGGHTHHVVPGNHSSMMRVPHVQKLAEKLKEEINKATS